eukprot:CAMPEP_0181308384 /NCGR_PEP_ID=MMETSP1101-20121128/11433_1 /TAXON_ID=46948 /ORGANISM="Rhodomonas abbreviata, Strain Caron Lab Isolate" /LENGTH=345 /DNA_ID=CAMNT_0023414761 /DNA_START=393 /DNA_END=1430 /DNA_ORIENTATION=+
MLTMNVLVHALAKTDPSMGFKESFFWRSVACVIVGALGCCCAKKWPFPEKPSLSLRLFLRGFLGAFAGLLMFLGVSSMESSSAVAIYSTAPFWALLFGWLWFSEKLDVWITAGMLLSFVGILFIIQPNQLFGGDTSFEVLRGEVIVLLAAVVVGSVGPQIRSIGASVHFTVLVLWLGAVGAALTSLVALVDGGGIAELWTFAGGAVEDWRMSEEHVGGATMVRWGRRRLVCTAMLGVSSALGQLCINAAWQSPASSQVTMVHMATLVLFQSLFDLFARRFTIPDPLSDIGLLCVLLGCTTVVWAKAEPPRPRNSDVTQLLLGESDDGEEEEEEEEPEFPGRLPSC